MTCIALCTGALWDKPAGGAWWIWDARLSAELLLLVLFVACIALRATVADRQRAHHAAALLSLAGAAALPLVFALANWWRTETHAASAGSARALELGSVVAAAAMVLMVAAFWAWCLGAVLHRLRSSIIDQADALTLADLHPERRT
jgi:heme exporter protein C